MSIFTIIVSGILLYLLSRTVVWYLTYHIIDWRATKESELVKKKRTFLTLLILVTLEIVVMFLLSPIIGLILINFSNADVAMRNTFKKTATSIVDPEKAKKYLKIAIELWELEVKKEG